jgi:cell growth-regulating nucleolar protein
MAIVTDAISNISKAPHDIRPHLSRMGDLSNIPRNENKFNNFVKNSLKIYNDKIIKDIWQYLNSCKADISFSSSPKQYEETEHSQKSMKSTDSINTPSSSLPSISSSHDEHKVKKIKKRKHDMLSDVLDSKDTIEHPFPDSSTIQNEVDTILNDIKDKKKKKKKKKSEKKIFPNSLE